MKRHASNCSCLSEGEKSKHCSREQVHMCPATEIFKEFQTDIMHCLTSQPPVEFLRGHPVHGTVPLRPAKQQDQGHSWRSQTSPVGAFGRRHHRIAIFNPDNHPRGLVYQSPTPPSRCRNFNRRAESHPSRYSTTMPASRTIRLHLDRLRQLPPPRTPLQ